MKTVLIRQDCSYPSPAPHPARCCNTADSCAPRQAAGRCAGPLHRADPRRARAISVHFFFLFLFFLDGADPPPPAGAPSPAPPSAAASSAPSPPSAAASCTPAAAYTPATQNTLRRNVVMQIRYTQTLRKMISPAGPCNAAVPDAFQTCTLLAADPRLRRAIDTPAGAASPEATQARDVRPRSESGPGGAVPPGASRAPQRPRARSPPSSVASSPPVAVAPEVTSPRRPLYNFRRSTPAPARRCGRGMRRGNMRRGGARQRGPADAIPPPFPPVLTGHVSSLAPY